MGLEQQIILYNHDTSFKFFFCGVCSNERMLLIVSYFQIRQIFGFVPAQESCVCIVLVVFAAFSGLDASGRLDLETTPD